MEAIWKYSRNRSTSKCTSIILIAVFSSDKKSCQFVYKIIWRPIQVVWVILPFYREKYPFNKTCFESFLSTEKFELQDVLILKTF